MLEARSHNGEIILTHETRVDTSVQWLWRMLQMGYAHTVVITRGEHSCGPLRKVYGDRLGCVWFPRSITYPPRDGPLAGAPALLAPGQVGLFLEDGMFWRLQLTAMILRVGGYNQLSVDTDIIMQDDFYWWMQQPDYKDYHLLSQLDGMGTLNIGVLYLRGASPSGPVAWALAESLLRSIRWREQPELMAERNSTLSKCWDQSVATDAVYSGLAGRPLFWRCLEYRQLDRSWETREDGKKLFLEENEKLFKPALTRRSFSMDRSGPRCHASIEGPAGLTALEGRLVVPHSRGEWPEALGGRAMGDIGPVASAFLQMMREAGTPMWPDPESPADQAAAAAVPAERFTYFSRHLVCDWAGCGQNGMFVRGIRPGDEEPCVVIGHFVVSPDKALGKRFQLMVNGHYSMDLATSMHGPGGPYFATNSHLQGLTHHAALRAGAHHGRRGQRIAAPSVIALAPGAISPGPNTPAAAAAAGGSGAGPLVLASKEQLIAVMEGLTSVAIAAARTLAVPQLSCDYPWMHRGPAFPYNGSHHVPWRYLVGEAFAPFGPSLDHLSCEWFAWVEHGCLHGPVHMERRGHGHVNPHPAARMLLSYEMEYLLQQLPPQERTPVPPPGANDGSSNLVVLPPGAVAGPDGVFGITLEQLSEQLRRVAPNHTVVWLEAPMRVVDLTGPLRVAHQQWVQHCCGLSWPRSYNHICFWNF